jgi:KUP system potassium uptake protein
MAPRHPVAHRGEHVSHGLGAWRRRNFWLTLGALGVVYGDIGTSPLYAVRQSVLATGGAMPMPVAVMGAISLIFWALIIVVTIKYICFVLRAHNRGEGGSLALAALAHRSPDLPRWIKSLISGAAVLGLSLFFGEALLTPAITVLAAVEGLRVEEPALEPLILPISLLILIGLFAIQSRGTGKLGRMLGPIILVWFIAIGVLGLRAIIETPDILWAVNPAYGIVLFVIDPHVAFIALGSVVLAVTGSEALFADLGHFGAKPIRIAWLYVVLPALVLNYFGQGAVILQDPANLANPFFILSAGFLHYPMVVLATLASIIASQAVITAVFSITKQAVQLGLLPRMEVRHTSATEFGQIYVPRANALLLAGVIAIVLIFKSSDALSNAYGLAVTGVFVISTFLVTIVALKQWKWKLWVVVAVFGTFATVDIAFFSSTLTKLMQGAWLPVFIAIVALMFMNIWRIGRRVLAEKVYGSGLSIDTFLDSMEKPPLRVAGTAIFITPRLDEVPGALLHNMKHNRVLHERVIFLRVDVQDVPFVPHDKRLTVNKLGKGFYSVEVHYGFFQSPDVPQALEGARAYGLSIDVDSTTFFIRRETLVPARVSAMAKWRTKLFIRLYASALEAAQFYRLPPGRVVELGSQTEI